LENLISHFSKTDGSSRQKSNKTGDMNNTKDEMNLIVIYRTFDQIAAEYTLFLSAHKIFSS